MKQREARVPGSALVTRPCRTDPISQFNDALREHELYPGQVTFTGPGNFRRFPTNGNGSDKPGFYSLIDDGTHSYGCFGDWSRNLYVSWASTDTDSMSSAERAEYDRRIREQRKQAKQEREREYQQGAEKARNELSAMADCTQHPYLEAKGVQPIPGLKISDTGELIIPIHGSGSKVISYQRIYETDGGFKKGFMSGGRAKSGWFKIPGNTDAVCICEGLATGLSIHEATNYTVIVAFSCGNLVHVAKLAKAQNIIICADNDASKPDNPGLKYAERAAQSTGARIAVPVMPPGTQGSDFNDIASVSGLESVREIIDQAVSIDVASRTNQDVCGNKKKYDKQTEILKPVKVISAVDFLTMVFPPRENLLAPWLPMQGIAMIHAYRGVGKTHISLGVACAVATGSTFLKWQAPIPNGVLFIDGEMPAVVLQERIAQTIAGMDGTGEATLNLITPDLQDEWGMPDLSTIEGQSRLEPYITGDVKLIVVDNISTLCRSGQENKGDSWLPVQEWALRMRARGKTVLLIHHDGKGGQQRGTSRKEDVLDTIIQLKHPADYTPDSGAVFEVHFMKNRGIHGDDVKPFEASLVSTGNEIPAWTTSSIEESTYQKVVNLLNEGWTQTDISSELEIVKSAVHKHKKKAVANGDFKP